MLNLSSVGTRYRQTEFDGGLVQRDFLRLEKNNVYKSEGVNGKIVGEVAGKVQDGNVQIVC